MTGPRKILVAGYYGAKNAGDEAILAGLLACFRAAGFAGDFTVITRDPADTRALHGVEGVAWNDIEAVIDAAQQADLVVVGGGGLFHDYWGVDPSTVLTSRQGGIAQYATPVYLAAMLGRPCALLGVGVGPLRTDLGRDLTRAVFELADLAYVRDQGSLDLVRTIGVSMEHVKLGRDLAFAAPPIDLPSLATTFVASLAGPVLGVALRHWPFAAGGDSWHEATAEALDRWQETTGGTPLFVPMQTGSSEIEDDLTFSRRIAERMRRSRTAAFLPESLNPLERFWVLGLCDGVLGMRMHALVAARRAGKNCVGLVYDPKVESLTDLFGARVSLDACTEDLAQAVVALDLGGMSLTGEVRNLLAEHDDLERPIREALSLTARVGRDLPDGGWLSRVVPFNPKLLTLMKSELAEARAQADALSTELKDLKSLLREQDARLSEVRFRLEEATRRIFVSDSKAASIESSRGWRALNISWRMIWSLREWARPMAELGSGLTAGLSRLVNAGMTLAPRLLRRAIHVANIDGRDLVDNSVVDLYTDDPSLFPLHRGRRSLTEQRKVRAKVSVVAVAKDEEAVAVSWLDSLRSQTRTPDELILIDNGSSDRTPELLAEFGGTVSFPVKVLSRPDSTLASCRNEGVRAVAHGHIAFTDFGCDVPSTWLESLVAPFEIQPLTDVVAGWYRCRKEPWRLLPSEGFLVPKLSEIDPQRFLPATRSLAITKDAWWKAGRFPDWLTYSGEDTYLGLELKRRSRNWAFVPDAFVVWHPPKSSLAAWRKLVQWSTGDGESGAFAWKHLRSMRVALLATCVGVAIAGAGIGAAAIAASRYGIIGVGGVLGSLGIGALLIGLAVPSEHRLHAVASIAQVEGFLGGIRRRPRVMERRFRDVRRVSLMLTGVPIDDTGGGSRGAQIANGFLQKGDLVVYVYEYPRRETIDLSLQTNHPHLLTVPTSKFDWKSLREEISGILESRGLVTIVEFPSREHVAIAKRVAREYGTVIYDKIDDWDSQLGEPWFDVQRELELVRYASCLVASSPKLARELRDISAREVSYIPNAVNAEVFRPSVEYSRPSDLPSTGPVLVYVGALWGGWFDWELLAQVASNYPSATIVLIGDVRSPTIALGPNVRFLGLKAQTELPAYLANAQVGIIPWFEDKVTQSTSPLKVYEYLSMGLPVVTPDLEAIPEDPLVYRARDRAEFVERVGEALVATVDRSRIGSFIEGNSWQSRIDAIDRLVDGRSVGTMATHS